MPSELICNAAFFMSGMNIEELKDRFGIAVSSLEDWYFDLVGCESALQEHFHVQLSDQLYHYQYTHKDHAHLHL